MAGFRILDPFPQYTSVTGAPLAGGYLRFYDTGTTTLKVVYGDKALTVNNGSTVTLDSSGRTNVDVWGDGAYRVRLYSAADVLIDEADNVELPGGAATSLPALVSGRFLTSDGAVLSWADIRQVPDPTGQANKVLGTDGTALVWEAKAAAPVVPTLPTGGVTQTTSNFVIGKASVQWGGDSAPASGNAPASKSVVFPVAYSTLPRVTVTATVASVSPSGFLPAVGIIVSTTGFTAKFDNNSGYDQAGETINAPITFDWIAVGIIP